jgi:microcystin-dependent protein
MSQNIDKVKLKERLENVIPFTGAPPEISNNNIITSNNISRPWKFFMTSIEHNNNDISNIIKNDCSNNNFVLESKSSNIYFKAAPNKKIEFYSDTKFIKPANFDNIISERINSNDITVDNDLTVNNDLTVENTLIVNDISLNGKIYISEANDYHIIGNLKVDGTLTGTSTQQTGGLNIVEATINSSTIGLTTPSTGKFTDVSINNDLNVKNNISIENTLNVSNNILLKNYEDDVNISELPQDTVIDIEVTTTNNIVYDKIDLSYGGQIINSITNSNQKLYLSKGTYIFKIIESEEQNHLNFSCDPNFEDNFEISNNSTGTVIPNNGKHYYGNGAIVNIEIKGYIGYIDIISNGYGSSNNKINFEKIFLYKHNVNLLNKLDIIDNSINTLLELGYDASFTNVNILGELFVHDDVSFNKNVNISGELIVENDVSFNKNVNISGELIVENDVSLNSKLFVQDDVSLNSKLFVQDDTTFNSKLFVQDDTTFNSKLFVKDDVSLNSKLFVQDDTTFNSKLFVQDDVSFGSNLIVDGDVSFNGATLNLNNSAQNFTINSAKNLFIDPSPLNDESGNVIIRGNLEVRGTETIVNSTIVEVSDNIIQMNANYNSLPEGGIAVKDSTNTERKFTWKNSGHHEDPSNCWSTNNENLHVGTGGVFGQYLEISGVQYSHVPRGIIVMWSQENPPEGWAICDGTNGTPDLRAKFIVGVGTHYENGETHIYNLKQAGGEAKVTLNINQMPRHSHHITATIQGGDHKHVYKKSGISNQRQDSREQDEQRVYHDTDADADTHGNQQGAHTHTLDEETDNEGWGQSHENRPPYYVLYYIMKL